MSPKYMDISKNVRSAVEHLCTKESQYLSFESAFKVSRVPSALVELNGYFREVNNAFCKFLGYTSYELLDKTWMELTEHTTLLKDLQLIEQCEDGRLDSYLLPKTYIHKNGEYLPTLLSVSFIEIDDDSFYLSQVFDLRMLKDALCELDGKS